jgi:shikimate kinase
MNMKQHVVLIGLPGSGKTIVGGLVAERLKAGFVDTDALLVRREGKPITMIFAEKGEAAFRVLERQEMDAALANEPAIIATGGGWAAQPGAIDGAKDRALLIYLRTRPDTAAQRAGPEGTRPLLMGGESPVERMRQLSKEREPAYTQAHDTIDTDRKTAAQVAGDVVRLAQTKAGW